MKMLFRFFRGVIVVSFFIWFLSGCCDQKKDQTYLGVSISEIEDQMEDVFSTWYPKIIDTVNGGYWTNFEYDWSLSQDQDKILVTQARGLWAASIAASVFPDSDVYKKAAVHGYKFLTEKLWDKDDGGFFYRYMLNASPNEQPYKLVYANAFALYALAEYAKINHDPDVISWIRRTFNWLETHAHDPEYGGYFNIVIPPRYAVSQAVVDKIYMDVDWSPEGWKGQNTSIHLLEAFTNVGKVLQSDTIRERLSEMLKLIENKMVSQKGYLHMYFSRKWEPVSYQDSSFKFIIENIKYDHVSFGHDIETAYLLLDASKELYGSPDTSTLQIAKKMVDHTLANGFDQDYYGLFYKGYYFNDKEKIEIVDTKKYWWAQAEAWHALALFASLYPDDTTYQEAFQKMWNYINTEIIDRDYNGWYMYGLDVTPESKMYKKADEWKGCYHNGRALIEVLKLATEKDKE